MNKIFNITILLILCTQNTYSQTAFHNFGNAQIHDQGKIGFHTNLINDGVFNQNLGLAGFYNSDNQLTISGTRIPRFFDMDVAVDNDLILEINTEISNGLNYILGNIVTPRINPNISLDYVNNAFYVSEDDLRLTDGYASITGTDSFSFPIGQDEKLRPLSIPIQTNNTTFSAAYFNEDANFTSTFSNFDTDLTDGIIQNININEFWDFNGTTNTTVTLSWDIDSNVSEQTLNLNLLRVVGWSITNNRWEDLGNTNTTGTLTAGTITSFDFLPSDYEAITFGSFKNDLLEEDNIVVYDVMTPNGDNNNEVFTIEGIENIDNTLQIFNRWGVLVFKTTNYRNTWNGDSDGRVTVKEREKLPTGTYYYVLKLTKSGKQLAGPIYIKN